MQKIVTLVMSGTQSLGDDVLKAASEAALRCGGGGGEPVWLAPGRACDLVWRDAGDTPDARGDAGGMPGDTGGFAAWSQAVALALADWPVDVFAQEIPDGGIRRKRFLLADMESTLIEQELLDEMAGLLGVRDRVADITRRAMNAEIDFASALRERVGLMRGMTQDMLEDLARRITLMPGAATLIATLRAKGVPCYIATGGFSFFAESVAAHLGCDGYYANTLEIVAGVVTGKLIEPVLDRTAKRQILERLASRQGVSTADAAAVGDGANDIDMIRAAGLGVGFRPKPALAQATPWQVRYGDLTSVLFIQGYHIDEFVHRSDVAR